jgi:hypothetical protein
MTIQDNQQYALQAGAAAVFEASKTADEVLKFVVN